MTERVLVCGSWRTSVDRRGRVGSRMLECRVFVVSFLVIFTFLLLNVIFIIYLYHSIIVLLYFACLCRPLLVS